MKIPNFDKAEVEDKKLSDYLLSFNHSVGKGKAKFFLSIGITKSNKEFLKKELMTILGDNEIENIIENEFGVNYIVDGLLNTTKGNKINLRTVWIIDKGKSNPRFITAYPKLAEENL